MRQLYDWTLQRVLRHPRLVLGVLALTLFLTGYLFMAIPKGFLPLEDTGQIFVFTEATQDISFDAMRQYQQEAARIVHDNPSVDNFMSAMGASGFSPTANTGRMFIRLKPRAERPPAEVIVQQLRRQFARLPNLRVYPQLLPTIRIGGQLTKALYQFTLTDTDTRELYHWAPIISDRMRTLPGLQDVNTDLQIASPQVVVAIDRDKASAFGVTAHRSRTP
jgi:HAE1 family hydrophobic/amphiphilic exporter-1